MGQAYDGHRCGDSRSGISARFFPVMLSVGFYLMGSGFQKSLQAHERCIGSSDY